MFKKPCMQFGSTALLLFVALVVGGCGTTTAYRATPEDTRDLSPAQARKLLIKTGRSVSGCNAPLKFGAVTHEKFQSTCEGPYRFADYPALVAMAYIGDPVEGAGANKTCINAREVPVKRGTGEGRWDSKDCMFYRAGEISAARDFVRAWYVWASTGKAFYLAREAAFEQEMQSYRSASVKPQLPEEAVKYKVQAELAVQQKRFDEAVDLYDQALGIAPWWPAGHYNRGLILGELQDFEEGIRALQKYLKLEPDAPNARAVQLKIYQWDSLVPRAEK